MTSSHLIFLAGLLAFVPMARATESPEQTLIAGSIQSGGYGAPVVAYTRLAGQDAVLVGGRGGWLINHRFLIGGAGYGVANRVPPPGGATPSDNDYRLNFGYGGLWLEYVFQPARIIHGSVGTLVGAGGLAYHRFRPKGSVADMEHDAVFVLEPALSVDLNVTTFMRFAFTGGYRVVRGVDMTSLGSNDANGVTLGALLKFGRF